MRREWACGWDEGGGAGRCLCHMTVHVTQRLSWDSLCPSPECWHLSRKVAMAGWVRGPGSDSTVSHSPAPTEQTQAASNTHTEPQYSTSTLYKDGGSLHGSRLRTSSSYALEPGILWSWWAFLGPSLLLLPALPEMSSL